MFNQDTLLEITSILSPSGHEEKIQEYIIDYCNKNLKNIKFELSNSDLYLYRFSKKDDKTILFDAHIDQVSCRIMRLLDDGLLTAKCFGINNEDILGKPVIIINEKGDKTEGIISILPPHLNKENEETIITDILCQNKEESAEKVSVGDPIVFDSIPRIINKNYIVGAGLDNHVGAYTLLELATQIDKLDNINSNFIIHFSRREEVSGLSYGNISIPNMPDKIDIIIVVDTEISTDLPNIESLNYPDVSMNKGPLLTKNILDNVRIYKYIKKIIEKNNLSHQIAMTDSNGSNNLDGYNRLNIYGQTVGIPLRYMHSSVESVSISDIKDTIKLLFHLFINLDIFFSK